MRAILNLLSIIWVAWAFVITPAAAQDRVLIFAAASLKEVLDEIVSTYPESDQIAISYASSGTLARQIEEGAPADIFISANLDWVDYLKKRGLINAGSVTTIAENTLVLVCREHMPVGDLARSLENKRIAMGDPAHVPAGIYAKQALKSLGLWPLVAPNLVFGENVRISLRMLDRGEVDAAIVYGSDIASFGHLEPAYRFDPTLHDPISYVASSVNQSAANEQLMAFLASDKAANSFANFGFHSADLSAQTRQFEDAPVDYMAIISLSLQVAFISMSFAIPLAFAVAYLLARVPFHGKAFVQALVMLPLVMPPVVTGYFLLVTFGNQGMIGQFLDRFGFGVGFHWTGACLAAAVMAFPLLVRPMRLAIEAIDIRLEQAAETLGASKWTRFRTIILPLSLPGIMAGGVLGFAKALGEFGATITFVSNIPAQTQTFSLAIYSLLQSPSGDRAALILIAVSAFLAISAVLLSEWVAAKIRRSGERDA